MSGNFDLDGAVGVARPRLRARRRGALVWALRRVRHAVESSPQDELGLAPGPWFCRACRGNGSLGPGAVSALAVPVGAALFPTQRSDPDGEVRHEPVLDTPCHGRELMD